MIDITDYLVSRRLSVEKAAAKSGLSRERFEEVARGSKASLKEVRLIANALNLPVSSLLDRRGLEPVQLLFRQTLAQRSPDISSQADMVSAQIRDVLPIAEHLDVDLNWLDVFSGLSATVQNAEAFAQLFRRSFAYIDELEPLLELPVILNRLGVVLLYSRDPSIEGVSAIVNGHAFIVLAARRFQPRTLFTIAHELGHIVGHHDKRANGYASVDKSVGDFNQIDRDEERFADAFAAALLLPRFGVLSALRDVRTELQIAHAPLGALEIAWVAHFFNVSFEVAARRFESLELLPDRGARALYQKIVDDHGNPEKYAASVNVPPRPSLRVETSPAIVQAAVAQIREGRISLGRAADALNVPVSTLVVSNSGIDA